WRQVDAERQRGSLPARSRQQVRAGALRVERTIGIDRVGAQLSISVHRFRFGNARIHRGNMRCQNQSTGTAYWAEKDEVIAQYLEKLLDVPDRAATGIIIGQLALSDAIALKGALLSFFIEAGRKASE